MFKTCYSQVVQFKSQTLHNPKIIFSPYYIMKIMKIMNETYFHHFTFILVYLYSSSLSFCVLHILFNLKIFNLQLMATIFSFC